MKVARWGNSLAIRLPAAIVEELQLKEGDDVEIGVSSRRRIEMLKSLTRAEKVARMGELLNKALPEGYKFNREEANSR